MTTAEIIAEFDQAYREFRELIAPATAEQWRMAGINNPEVQFGEDERRPVGTIVHHVAVSYRNLPDRARAWMRGEDQAMPSAETNARHAAEHPDPEQQETVRLLDEHARELHEFIAGLSEEDLQATGTWFSGPTTVESLLGGVAPFHTRWHAGSIRATWAQNQG